MNVLRPDFNAAQGTESRSSASQNKTSGDFESLLDSTIAGQTDESSEGAAGITPAALTHRRSSDKEKASSVQYSLLASQQPQTTSKIAGGDHPEVAAVQGSSPSAPALNGSSSEIEEALANTVAQPAANSPDAAADAVALAQPSSDATNAAVSSDKGAGDPNTPLIAALTKEAHQPSASSNGKVVQGSAENSRESSTENSTGDLRATPATRVVNPNIASQVLDGAKASSPASSPGLNLRTATKSADSSRATGLNSAKSIQPVGSQEDNSTKSDPNAARADAPETDSTNSQPLTVKRSPSAQTPDGQRGGASQDDSHHAGNPKFEPTTPVTQAVSSSASSVKESGTADAVQSRAPQQINAEQVIDQIATGVKNHTGATELQILLRPENLGLVHIRLARVEGNLTARITTASDAVRQTLEQHLPQLQATLADRGAHVTEITVSTSHAPMSFQDGQSSRQPRPDQAPARTFRPSAEVAEAPEPQAIAGTVSDRGVNVLA